MLSTVEETNERVFHQIFCETIHEYQERVASNTKRLLQDINLHRVVMSWINGRYLGLSYKYLPPTPVRYIDTTVLGKTFHNTDNLRYTPSEQSLNISVISTDIDWVFIGDLKNSSKLQS